MANFEENATFVMALAYVAIIASLVVTYFEAKESQETGARME